MTIAVQTLEINSGGGWAKITIDRNAYGWRYRANVDDLPQDMYDTLKTWLEGRTT